MFNEAVKLLFLDENCKSAKSKTRFSSLFRSLEMLEEKNGDASSWGEEVIKKFFSGKYSNSRYLKDDFSNLRRYCTWCYKHNVAGAVNTIDNINVQSLFDPASFAKKMISSPENLLGYLEEYFSPINLKSMAAWVWFILAYIGVDEQDIFAFSRDNYNGKVVKIREFEYEIPNCLYMQLDICVNMCNDDTHIVNANFPSFKSEYVSQYMRKMACKRPDRLYKYTDVYKSGLFFRIYSAEKEGNDPSVLFEAEAQALSESMQYTGYGDTERMRKSVQSRIASKKRQLMDDYEMWKLAFHIDAQ